jgi:hypothetical protein
MNRKEKREQKKYKAQMSSFVQSKSVSLKIDEEHVFIRKYRQQHLWLEARWKGSSFTWFRENT